MFYLLLFIIHLFNLDRSKNFTIKNIFIAPAKLLNDKDGVLIKVNKKKITKKQQKTMVRVKFIFASFSKEGNADCGIEHLD